MSADSVKAAWSHAGVWSWCAANRHFLTAAIILSLAAGGWNAAVRIMKLTTRKEPVAWPKCVQVNEETFQNTTMATVMGPFKRLEVGEIPGRGKLGGEIQLEEDVLEPLGIGTWLDKKRVSTRCSNWYVSRLYRDTRTQAPSASFRFWQLDVTYYTGSADKVPHSPGACLAAGGATLVDTVTERFDAPDAPDPWKKSLPFSRTRFEGFDAGTQQRLRYVQYYIFSANGKPENDPLTVRGELMLPWRKHCYFAKIQFGPLGPIGEGQEAEEKLRNATAEFIGFMLPKVLEALPSAEEIERLESSD